MIPDEEREGQDWEWARKMVRKSPPWSDAKWKTMNSLLRLNFVTQKENGHPSE